MSRFPEKTQILFEYPLYHAQVCEGSETNPRKAEGKSGMRAGQDANAP